MSRDTPKETVTLAMYVGQGDQLEIDGHLLVRGVQYEVTHGMKTRLRAQSDVQVIDTEVGSDLDARPMVETPDLPALGPEDAPVAREAQNPNMTGAPPVTPDDSEEM